MFLQPNLPMKLVRNQDTVTDAVVCSVSDARHMNSFSNICIVFLF
jgi:hypothetical protein